MNRYEKELQELLDQLNAKLVRTGTHRVYRLPNGKMFTTSATASDERATMNQISDLRGLAELPREKRPNAGQRRPARIRKPHASDGSAMPRKNHLPYRRRPAQVGVELSGPLTTALLRREEEKVLAAAQELLRSTNVLASHGRDERGRFWVVKFPGWAAATVRDPKSLIRMAKGVR